MEKRIFYSTVGITYPDIYTSGSSLIQEDKKFLELLSKNISIYESETIVGPFTKEIARQFYEINK